MIRKLALLPAVAACIVTGTAFAETLAREARSGQLSPLLSFSIYNVDTCYAGGLAQARVVTPPAHGKVEFRQGQSRVAGSCGTLVALSQQVFYTSRGGFRGADEMVIEFEYNPTVEAPRTTSRRYTIRVQVR
ncbi:MAG: hypothetical protein O9333_11305 [Beijerinckiaceae bacterium]|nr:hypothetical protein [Beijerinckiaceae bacterium]